ncbi:response regulator [Lutimonas saemankumensis]|uniref:response regulator n=1 Tax=Lutimonas saemankumensis TaxID=483016 RepID=UPI001CD7F0EF|nr:response regulator [Lutimonas saemankumensis]MCA0932772.1 response regulator [Lutimonas saemankumensis]
MKKKILIIEDDTIVRENTTEILQLANYEVISAENGKIGIEKASFFKPDLIICDILMPDLDGYGVLQILMRNKSLQKIPVVFMSAKTKHEDIRRGMDLGASDYITKPFEESELLSAVATRLKRKEIYERNINEENRIPRKLKIDEIERAFKFKESVEYKAGSTIYCEGNVSNHIFFIVKGEVKTFKVNQDGKELITEIYSDKSFFGFTSLLESSPYVENAESIKDTKILKIQKNEFYQIIKDNPELGLNFIDMLSHDLEFIKDHLMHLVYDSVRRKTADAIIQLHDKRGGQSPIEISRSDLASFLGIAKETLTRTLTDFKEENLIYTQKNEIQIKDRERLQKIQ